MIHWRCPPHVVDWLTQGWTVVASWPYPDVVLDVGTLILCETATQTVAARILDYRREAADGSVSCVFRAAEAADAPGADRLIH